MAKAERGTGDETAPGARLVHYRAILRIVFKPATQVPSPFLTSSSSSQHVLVSLASDNYANLAPFTVRDEKLAHGHFRVAAPKRRMGPT